MDHVEVLKMNGFELLIDEEAPVGQRVKLVALPLSKGTSFGVDGLFPAPPEPDRTGYL